MLYGVTVHYTSIIVEGDSPSCDILADYMTIAYAPVLSGLFQMTRKDSAHETPPRVFAPRDHVNERLSRDDPALRSRHRLAQKIRTQMCLVGLQSWEWHKGRPTPLPGLAWPIHMQTNADRLTHPDLATSKRCSTPIVLRSCCESNCDIWID